MAKLSKTTLRLITLFKLPFIAELFCRGHTVRAVTESFQMAKDAGFKVVAHMMPDLPNVDLERDIDQFVVSVITIFYFIVSFIVIFYILKHIFHV